MSDIMVLLATPFWLGAGFFVSWFAVLRKLDEITLADIFCTILCMAFAPLAVPIFLLINSGEIVVWRCNHD